MEPLSARKGNGNGTVSVAKCSNTSLCCQQPPFLVALASGGIAGFAVDVSLFPLDTIKTRLQSPFGFFKSGGFKRIFAGLGPTAAASVPCAAAFFAVYEELKKQLPFKGPPSHMAAASCGEVVACLLRVPAENVKQKLQAGVYKDTTEAVGKMWFRGGVREFFTGYFATLMREIPFSLIQFPIYEESKVVWARLKKKPVTPWEAALCGCFAGGVAAGFTTPVDVVKTRLMIGTDPFGVPYKGMGSTMLRVVKQEGPRALFSGIVPRVVWVALGGAVFFGMYEQAKYTLCELGSCDVKKSCTSSSSSKDSRK